MFKTPKKEDPQNNYKYIHMKNINMGSKKLSQNIQDKNMEYFPTRPVKRQSGTNNLDNSKSSANIRESSQTSRYSKRQSHFSNSVQEQNRNILKQNDRLKKEVKRLEKMLLEKEDNATTAKNLQLELVETYRVINYYEGKIKELEKICKQYERQLENNQGKKSKSSKITALLQDLRTSNSELRGKNEQKQMEVETVTTELRKMQSKFHMSQQKIIQLNKRIIDTRLGTSRPKFMDDYEQKNLNYLSQPQKEHFVKRRPQLSRSKKILKTTSRAQSDSDASGASSQYKTSVYIRRKDGTASKPKEDSLRNSKNKYLSLGNGNLSSKLTMIQNQVEALKKQNEKLHEQLDLKVKEMIQLKEEKQGQKTNLKTFHQQNTKSSSQKQLKIVTISKSKLKEIENPNIQPKSTPKAVQSNNLSQFVSNISMKGQSSKQIPQSSKDNDRQTGSRLSSFQKQSKKKTGYTFTEIKDRTIRLLTMNVVRQDINYFKLIQNIVTAWTSQNPNSLIEILQDAPYLLSSAQTAQFMFEYKNIIKFISGKEREAAHKDMNEAEYKKYVADEIKAILKDNIPYFKNITIRRDFTLNIQLANKFKNYEQQLEEIMKKYGNKMPYSEWERIFINKWGLTAEQGLFLQIKNFQQFKDIDFIHIADLGRYFLLE